MKMSLDQYEPTRLMSAFIRPFKPNMEFALLTDNGIKNQVLEKGS